MSSFALHATLAGGTFARLPEVQKALNLSESVYGLVLLGMPVGVILGSMTISPLMERRGPKAVLVIGLPLTAALQVPIALSPSAGVMGLAMFVYGVVFATGNLAMNVEADRFEAAQGRRIMNRSHGTWALGFLAASLAAAGCLRLGLSPATQFAGHAVLMAAAVLFLLGPLEASPPRAEARPPKRFAVPNMGAIAITAFALGGLVMEGITRSWAVIYARDTFAAVEWVAVLALPAIVITQTIGRFLGDTAATRWGDVNLARASSVVLFVGTVIIAAAPALWVLMLGLLLVGLGISVVQPQAFAASARLGGRPASENMAAYATLSTLVGFLTPTLFGALAETIGQRGAFALLVPLPVISFYFARALRPARPS